MHVARIERNYKGKLYVTSLLRHSFREGGHVKHKTLANLSHLPDRLVDIVRRSLKGEDFVSLTERFRITRSLPHGHVEAVLGCMRQLGIDTLLGAKPSRSRDLVMAMIAERILFPSSKLASTRHWHSTTLAEELHVDDADVDELYAAMDWLLESQAAIESKLAQRHLAEGALVLYDVSSSFYEGKTCPLARYGHDRDGKKNLPIIVYGLLTDSVGRPVAIEAYPGNTGDPKTVPDQVDKLRGRFGLERVVLVGDRGMLTETQIGVLRQHPGLGWISALRSQSIAALLADGHLQRSLFDEVNLAEIKAPEFPGERLIACYNPLLAEQRRHKREELLAQTEKKLRGLAEQVRRRTHKLLSQTSIALKVGKFINRWKMAKHFLLTIADGVFNWERHQGSISQEEQLDGIYVIRTSEPKRRSSAADSIRGYKRLAQVERAFRTFKGVDLLVRPIFHHVEARVRAHLFLCMLAYYVQWHMRAALAPLLFVDEELKENTAARDPVAKTEPSASVKAKKHKRHNAGFPVHSFRTLLAELGSRCRNTCMVTASEPEATFTQVTDLTPLHAEVFRLLNLS